MTPRQAMDAVLELYGLRYPDASAVIRDLAQRGFVIVPETPTEAMSRCSFDGRLGRHGIWIAMIKASQ
jgi:hypothetical protein